MSEVVKLKVGSFEYEGSEEFLISQLPELLDTLSAKLPTNGSHTKVQPSGNAAPLQQNSDGGALRLTVTSVAAKTGAKSGSDLIKAVLAHAKIVEAKPTLHRREILDSMKTATGYYKETMASNMGQYLVSVVKSGEVVECSKDTYTLNPTMLQQYESTLAS